jgi:hypothetical protein
MTYQTKKKLIQKILLSRNMYLLQSTQSFSKGRKEELLVSDLCALCAFLALFAVKKIFLI